MAVQSNHFHALRKEWVLLVVFSPVLYLDLWRGSEESSPVGKGWGGVNGLKVTSGGIDE